MPIIEHANVKMPPVADRKAERYFVSRDHGALSLSIKEVELHPGYEGRMHTHPTDIAVMVTGGAIQMEIGDEIHTVRVGSTMVAPPGVSHRLINQLWVPATVLVIFPTTEVETNFLE